MLLSGYSLAVAMGEDVDASASSPSQLAEPMLTDREREMYSAWRKGKSPPRVDWRRVVVSMSSATPAQRARWTDLTDALRTLYEDKNISKENCKAWVEKYPEAMPLLSACRKVETIRRDARGGKASSKARRELREVVACRSLMSSVGAQKVRSNTSLKKLHKEADERELELTKRLARLDMDAPRDKETAVKKFQAREAYWSKLTKIRLERLEKAADVNRQNSEIDAFQKSLQNRITVLEDRLRRGRS